MTKAHTCLFACLLSVAPLAAQGTVADWGTVLTPPAPSGYRAIASGDAHTIGLKYNGSVVAWGTNANGQTAVPAAAQSGVLDIAAGSWHSLALKADGSVVAWGLGTSGQTTVPAAAQTGVIAIAAGGAHSLALKSNGAVVAWGSDSDGQSTVPADALSGIIAIAAGEKHSLALTAGGRVVAWGANNDQQTAVPVSAQSGIIAVAAGGSFSLALTSNGSVVAWGDNGAGQATVPVGALSQIVAIAAGPNHAIALRNDGSVVAWGDNSSGQTNVPAAGLQGVTAISARRGATVVLKGGGWLASVGLPGNWSEGTVPSGLSGVTHVAAGNSHNVVCKADGSLLVWGSNNNGETNMPALLEGTGAAKTVVAGPISSFALTSNGDAISWGGLSTALPVDVTHDYTHTRAIAAGGQHNLELKDDGAVVAWGSNSQGQATVPADALSGVKAVAAGDHHSIALKTDGSVVAWGVGLSQSTVPPQAQSGVRAIAAAANHNIVLKDDGSVFWWGADVASTPLPAGLGSGVISVYAGYESNAAIKADGSIVHWGTMALPASLNAIASYSPVLAVASGPDRAFAVVPYSPALISLDNDNSATASEGSVATKTGTHLSDTDLTFFASVGTVAVTSGTSKSGTWRWSYTPADRLTDSQTVTVTARSSDGKVGTVTFLLVVTNAAPVITAFAGPPVTTAGLPATFTGRFTDAGAGDTHTCTFDWGDGSTTVTVPAVETNGSGSCTQSHTFTATATRTVTLTVTDSGSATAQQTASINVSQVVPVTWTVPASINYGTPLSATQLNATAQVPGTFVYNPPAGTVLRPGSYTLSVAFTPTDTAHYLGSTATVTLVVNPAIPTVRWSTPAPIAYGTALSDAQLNATASVLGTFVYTPKAGAIPEVGNQRLSAVFTPSVPDYAPVTSSVTLTVVKATPVVNWKTPEAIPSGSTLGDQQLNATANIPGTFVYSLAAGTRVANGDYTLTVTFTPTDSVHYNTATAQVVLHVGPVVLTSVSAASFERMGLAPGALFSVFGAGLADHSENGGSPLPTTLAGVTITLTDSTGAQFLAPLLYVGPTQVNFLVPEGIAPGAVQLSLTRASGPVLTLATTSSAVAPGLFSATANGTGVATGNALRVTSSDQRFESALSTCTQSGCTAVPIDLGAETDKVYISLYGTGVRHRTALSAVTVTVGGRPATVQYAGEQSQFAGLDQINILLPRELAGKGEVAVVIAIDGMPCNTVWINVR